MVDKGSLRSNKRSTSKDTNSSSGSSKKTSQPPTAAAQRPTRSSSRKTKQSASQNDEGAANEVEAAENGAEDVEMKDASHATIPAAAPTNEVVVPTGKGDDKDVEMQVEEAPGDGKEERKDDDRVPEDDPIATAVNEIKQNFSLLERGVANFDARYTLRVLRTVPSLRRRVTADVLRSVVKEAYPSGHSSARILLDVLSRVGTSMEVDNAVDSANSPNPISSSNLLPEIDVYLHFMVQVFLLDQKANELGAGFSTELVKKVHILNRRTLDSLAAKVYYYYSRFHELQGNSALLEIRPQLLASLRTAMLRKDIDTQATIITLLLRNYLATQHITQADLLVSKTKFPESAANNLIARYQYYVGKIRAIQLDYTGAHQELTGATRKAPQTAAAAGFIQAAHKLLIVVELLMGDIPDRALFRQSILEKPLRPYFELVKAVRVGELDSFFQTLNKHAETFKKDGTYTLISRLRQNVIKTGIRTISLSYSRISLRDICVRLRLDSEESAEYIVAKAIRDGVIEATLNHEKGYMQSKELMDVYATQEPQEAFNERIMACMSLHNESVKAMRFPMNQHRLELKSAQEARERERELAKEIQEGEIDDDDAGGDFEGL